MLAVGSLFTGIGGFDLGFERAGMRVVWQCEQNDYCRRVLARHWPRVPCHPDVRALVADTSGARRRQDVRGAHARWGAQDADQPDRRDEGDGAGPVLPVPVPYVDVLSGGFPCQDLSYAGKGAGIDGERSGLWREFARLIGELRPRYVVIENVPALAARGLDRVLADLAACGLDAEWDHLPASAFGAPHRRDRVWVVAYAGHGREPERPRSVGWNVGQRAAVGAEPRCDGAIGHVADTERYGRTTGSRLEGAAELAVSRNGRGTARELGGWAVEPNVGRVAHGVPDRVDRLAALGNALIPQIAEFIGRRIIEWETASGRLATLPD